MSQKEKKIHHKVGQRPTMHLVPVMEGVDAKTMPKSKKSEGVGRGVIAKRLAYLVLALVVGVLLGRAVLLQTLSPFALAAFAVAMMMKKGTSLWLGTGLVLGAFTAESIGANPVLLLTMLISFQVITALWRRFDSLDLHIIPFIVFVVDTGFRIGFLVPMSGFNLYTLGMSFIDGFLALLLTLMFLQMPSLLSTVRPRTKLRTDELIALIILAASLLTGLHGVTVHGLSLESILARYMVVIVASFGGAGIGGAVGVVTGVILALGAPNLQATIGMFGFSGVLAGMIKEGKRIVVGLGFLLGATALSLYLMPIQGAMNSLEESAIAILLFLLTPSKITQFLSQYIPGTEQHALTQQEHARKIRELMTARISEVANVFSELAVSFHDTMDPVKATHSQEQTAIDLTARDLCQFCRKHERCFGSDAAKTYEAMKQTVQMIEIDPDLTVQDIVHDMYSRCIKLDQLLPSLRRSISQAVRDTAVIAQLKDSRRLVEEQLAGVAGIMKDLADQIRHETGVNHQHETQILSALSRLGLEIQAIDIISLEEGQVEIQVFQMDPSGHDECGKLVAPLLSEILGETIGVQKVERSPDGTYELVTLSSAKVYDVKHGFACVAKDGSVRSGDSFSAVDVGNGRFAIAISDGMGNGEKASKESGAAVSLVQQLLKAGFDESITVKTVNSALVLRSTEEMYATLDLAVIDLYTLQAEFLKVGSVTSFIKEGRNVFAIRGESVPIGILNDIDVQVKKATLAENDILVFISDGILEAVSHMQDPEDWVKRQLERYDSTDPQMIADFLLEAAVRTGGGGIPDDMTVFCAKMVRYKPEWATIRVPDMPSIRNRRVGKRAAKREPRKLVTV